MMASWIVAAVVDVREWKVAEVVAQKKATATKD